MHREYAFSSWTRAASTVQQSVYISGLTLEVLGALAGYGMLAPVKHEG